MPTLSKIFVGASYFYLLAGAFLGVLLSLSKVFPQFRFLFLIPVHLDFMIFGWFFNFIAGVSWWILPRLKEGTFRGNPIFPAITFILVNLGLMISLFSAFFRSAFLKSFSPHSLRFFSYLLFSSGIFVFVFQIFRRIKPPPIIVAEPKKSNRI
jgi:cbb3-type cytochrome oxidase subunit 1